ncbi:MspA family porin [Mycolicibacterium fortuitum]|uniref:MspA family porin n=1 Tax=Mycolicibacterium fortuitum TaxID=1766 RepID=UPI001F1CEC2B|nr:MspA family porin [Mycolicibacterium fortuitum]
MPCATAAAAAPAPPPPDTGAVPSSPPGVLDTPDGWHVTVAGSNETLLPVAPLTTAISSREYLVGGTFTGKVSGGGKTKLTGGGGGSADARGAIATGANMQTAARGAKRLNMRELAPLVVLDRAVLRRTMVARTQRFQGNCRDESLTGCVSIR